MTLEAPGRGMLPRMGSNDGLQIAGWAAGSGGTGAMAEVCEELMGRGVKLILRLGMTNAGIDRAGLAIQNWGR